MEDALNGAIKTKKKNKIKKKAAETMKAAWCVYKVKGKPVQKYSQGSQTTPSITHSSRLIGKTKKSVGMTNLSPFRVSSGPKPFFKNSEGRKTTTS
jgi:exopolysaccharide biosynthesis protein